MDIIDYIPKNKDLAVKRSVLCILTGLSDRKVRAEIHKARRDHVILNLQDGDGYYQPDLTKEEDISDLRRYIEQETSRLKSIGWSLKSARIALRKAENEQ